MHRSHQTSSDSCCPKPTRGNRTERSLNKRWKCLQVQIALTRTLTSLVQHFRSLALSPYYFTDICLHCDTCAIAQERSVQRVPTHTHTASNITDWFSYSNKKLNLTTMLESRSTADKSRQREWEAPSSPNVRAKKKTTQSYLFRYALSGTVLVTMAGDDANQLWRVVCGLPS